MSLDATPTVVVFDISKVLVDWQPELAWADHFDDVTDIHAFMERVDFYDRNLRGDNGETFVDMAQELDDPADQKRLADYVPNYAKTVQNAVPGTWEILDDLKSRGVPVHAITNWSAETWPEGLKAHPRLAEVFGTLVVSGREGVIKPDRRIFDILCERANVAPEDCVFIDDSPKNVDGARAAGWDAIHFTGADALRTALEQRGLL
ncbi:HAD family hydrolase [Thalassovita mediterranea]|jgi:FMN phosphatase YigB (HAD superfamily)|uniref:Phosphorylated carbohydrates phosphatase n=1 Tax=Thalassovita mediterranea TaxID=340021 RepID=A0A0P1GQ16_9RHOB|nr:HAD family phosphatase [Thalassovita mediterranea]CUH84353.1 Phosphorylated carbohydrates phosphatase [Thalassovita mediterranea]SIS31913.1 2-haloacid dehalogenase [Thalassovita mediterranea]